MINASAKPYLPRGVRIHDDQVRGASVLLAPERALMLDAISTAILGELDGARSIDEIATDLAKRYEAPKDVIEKDVIALLDDLVTKRFVEIQ